MTAPEILYWQVWRDDRGISHQRRVSLGSFTLGQVSPGSAQIWQRDGGPPSKVLFLELVPSQDSGWHEDPAPQWIVPLSGRWFVETIQVVDPAAS